jgi:hypothetical protein
VSETQSHPRSIHIDEAIPGSEGTGMTICTPGGALIARVRTRHRGEWRAEAPPTAKLAPQAL